MNPEDSSTEKLSGVFIDRFDIIHMSYPETDAVEMQIVLAKGKKLDVKFPPEMLEGAIRFVRELRENADIEQKPGVRASLGLYERAQANALLAGRKAVMLEDIEEAIVSVVSHRMTLKPSVKYLRSPEEFAREEFRKFTEHYDFSKEKGGGL
jgi:MoxR-like ATPase